jgi:hypothetical protein
MRGTVRFGLVQDVKIGAKTLVSKSNLILKRGTRLVAFS